MQQLDQRQRAFVVAYSNSGGKNATQAAVEAGYGPSRNYAHKVGSNLLRDPRVKAALIEFAQAELTAMLPRTKEVVGEILETGDNKEKLKAVGMIWGRGGLHEIVEHQHLVKLSKDETIRQIKELCAYLKLDAKTMLGRVVDAEYSVATDPDFAAQEVRPALAAHRAEADAVDTSEADEEDQDPFGGLLG
jgi:hypothetical protein